LSPFWRQTQRLAFHWAEACAKCVFLAQAAERVAVRTLYVFGGAHMPLFLLTVFAKNEKDNLSRAEQADLIETSKRITAAYGEQK
jgi:hypothetical protein